MVVPTSNPSYTKGWDRTSVNLRSAWAAQEETYLNTGLNPECSRPLPMLSTESSILGLILYLTSIILPNGGVCSSWWSWAEHCQRGPSAITIRQCPCSCYKWLMLLFLLWGKVWSALLIHLVLGIQTPTRWWPSLCWPRRGSCTPSESESRLPKSHAPPW